MIQFNDTDIIELAIKKYESLSNMINNFSFGYFDLEISKNQKAIIRVDYGKIKEITIEDNELGLKRIIRPDGKAESKGEAKQ